MKKSWSKLLYLQTKPITIVALVVVSLFFNATQSAHAQEITQDENYELYPIAYEPERFGNNPTNQLIESLIKDQGYQVHCAAKEWTIDAKLWNEANSDKFFSKYNNNSQIATFSGDGTYTLNLIDAKVPMYRNLDTENTTKTSSYEAFFGSLVPEYIIDPDPANLDELKENPTYDTTQAGVANHLLTPSQQCRIKYDNLVAVHSICSAQFDPTDCRINTNIKGTNYNRWALFGDIFDLIADLEPGDGGGLNCEELMGTWEELIDPEHPKAQLVQENRDVNGLTDVKFYAIQDAINKMSFDIENLYRIAFLVIAPLQDPNTGIDKQTDNSAFYDNNDTNTAQHSPLFIAFKVPDFMANRSWHRDSSLITRWALTSAEQQQADLEQIDGQRERLYQEVLSRLNDDKAVRFRAGDPIYCPDIAVCQRNEQNPDAVIKNALIDIVNSIGGGRCLTDLAYEKAGNIYTPAGTYLKTPSEKVASFYPSQDFIAEQTRTFKWAFNAKNKEQYNLNFQANPPANSITVNAYIIGPSGLQQELLFNALQGLFTTEQQQALKDENLVIDSFQRGIYPEFFTMPGVEFGFTSNPDVVKFGFPDEDNCKWEWDLDPKKILPGDLSEDEARILCQQETPTKPYYCLQKYVCPQLEFGKGVEEKAPDELKIVGAKVGWSIRKIQESITSAGTEIYGYFSSCNRIEDLFLGRCGYDEDFSATE